MVRPSSTLRSKLCPRWYFTSPAAAVRLRLVVVLEPAEDLGAGLAQRVREEVEPPRCAIPMTISWMLWAAAESIRYRIAGTSTSPPSSENRFCPM
jgi:hypothetical protein